jgi:hypothetical protein
VLSCISHWSAAVSKNSRSCLGCHVLVSENVIREMQNLNQERRETLQQRLNQNN